MKRWILWTLAAAALALSLAGCAGKAEKTAVDMASVYAQVQDKLPEMYQMDEGTMLNYLGINMEDCAQAVVAVASDGLRADEIWLIEAKDDQTLESIQELAQNRLTAKEAETVQYAPDQYAVVKDARLLTQGRYLALLVSPEAETIKAFVESAWK